MIISREDEMKFRPFLLERYFADKEFTLRYSLSSSDCESFQMNELLAMADDRSKKLWDDLALGYTESAGHPILLKEIAKLYSNINENEVIVGVPEELILVIMFSMLEKGDHVICTFPGYQSLYEIAKMIGCDVTYWMPEERETWDFDINFVKDNLRGNTKAVIVNFPNNPTGAVLNKNDFQSLIEIVRERNVLLFSDEMYWHLAYSEKYYLPAAADIYQNAVSLFGMSKTFGMPGLRIGWLATRNKELMKRIASFKDYTTICSSAPSEVLALIGLRNRDEIINRSKNIINNNMNVFGRFVRDSNGLFTWSKPMGGPVAFVKFNHNMGTDKLAEAAAKENILLLPSKVFEYGNSHIRFGLGRKNFEEGINRFAETVLSKL